MPSSREIIFGIYGAWRLALLDQNAMTYFDRTAEGFWKSFFAAAIVVPGYIILLFLDPGSGGEGAGWLRVVVVHAAAYTLGWTVYPLAVSQICNTIGKAEKFIGFIVALNWSKVIQMVVYLPIIVLTSTGAVTPGGVALLTGLMYVLVLGYQWIVTRAALEVSPMAAVGFVVFDLFLSFFIHGISLGMLH